MMLFSTAQVEKPVDSFFRFFENALRIGRRSIHRVGKDQMGILWIIRPDPSKPVFGSRFFIPLPFIFSPRPALFRFRPVPFPPEKRIIPFSFTGYPGIIHGRKC